jgi:hypothetical protein
MVFCTVTLAAGAWSALASFVCRHDRPYLLTSFDPLPRRLVVPPEAGPRAPLPRIIVTLLTMLKGYNHCGKN